MLLGWGWPRLQKYGPWRRTVQNQLELDRLMYAEIRERREAPDLADRHRRTLPADPHRRRWRRPSPTRSCATSWSPSCSPATRPPRPPWPGRSTRSVAIRSSGVGPARPRSSGDDDWLEALLKESMRLHPVIPMVVRTLMRPADHRRHRPPAGATVGPSILIAHSREDNHPDPTAFKPERFVGHNPPTNTWIPFGGGVRRCIGAGFSLMEGVAVLREVFASYDVHGGRRRRAQGPQHHQRPAPRSPDPGAPHRLIASRDNRPYSACGSVSPVRRFTIVNWRDRLRAMRMDVTPLRSRATSGCCSSPGRSSTSARWSPTSPSRSRSTP